MTSLESLLPLKNVTAAGNHLTTLKGLGAVPPASRQISHLPVACKDYTEFGLAVDGAIISAAGAVNDIKKVGPTGSNFFVADDQRL